MQKILKNIVWGCLFIIPFLALYIADCGGFDFLHWGTAGLFFPFITGKNFVFRALVELAFASWVILAINDAKYRIKKSPLVLAYALFMMVILVADIFGVDTHASMWSNYERMEGFVGHIHMFVYFLIMSSMLTTESEWLNMFKVFIASNILVMGYGFMQVLGSKELFFAKWAPVLSAKIGGSFPIHQGGDRIDSTIGNSSYYGIYCLFFAFISALLYSQVKTSYEKWIYGIIVVLNLISIYYTGTRGTMVGFLGAIFVTFALLAWHEKGRIRKILISALVLIAILVGSIFVFKDSSFVKSSNTLSRFANMSFSSDTGGSRMTIWKMSYEGWKEKQILGYGQDNFIYVFPRQFNAEKMYNQEPWFDRSHDVFFDWLVAGGILGLLSYLSIFVVALCVLWKKGSAISFKERAIITGALIGYFIHNIFVFDNLTSYILFFALLAYIVSRTSKEVYCGHKHVGDWKEIVPPVMAVMFVAMFYYVTYLPHLTNTLVIRAIDINRLIQTTPFADVLKIQKESFNSAIDIGLLGKQEAVEQFMQTAPRMLSYKIPDSLPTEKKNEIIQAENDLIVSAKTRAEKLAVEYKDNVRVLDILGMFYNAVGDGANAEKVLNQALSFAPKKQLVMFDMVRAYLIEGKNNEAYNIAMNAYLLEPAYTEAQKFYVISAVYAHKLDEAKKVLLKNNQTVPVDNDIINSLVQNGQKNEAINLLLDYKKKNPEASIQVDSAIKQIQSR